MYRFEFDLAVLNDMHDQVRAASGNAEKDGKAMMERIRQRRNKGQTVTASDADVVELLKQRGIPVETTGE